MVGVRRENDQIIAVQVANVGQVLGGQLDLLQGADLEHVVLLELVCRRQLPLVRLVLSGSLEEMVVELILSGVLIDLADLLDLVSQRLSRNI